MSAPAHGAAAAAATAAAASVGDDSTPVVRLATLKLPGEIERPRVPLEGLRSAAAAPEEDPGKLERLLVVVEKESLLFSGGVVGDRYLGKIRVRIGRGGRHGAIIIVGYTLL